MANAFEAIHCLAVVNRGEAALRCIRAVKALRALERSPLRVLALYTDEDRDAPFVRHADRALRLPVATTPVAAYLDHELLVRVLREARADAVWPGWGFVAESPAFVERLHGAGIRFLGPSAETMRRLGDKIASKQLAEAAGVPVTPWSGGVVEDFDAARACAERIDFPLVIKASAGGGGRGIRMVDSVEGLQAAFESAASEARAAFGDGRLFIEQMVRGGRHVEVQVAADRYGRVVALGCRDCSVQRRHQKVIEEAPPPGLEPELQRSLMNAAVELAKGAEYSGVGTVEFMVCGPRFFFLEMNPRLQVEHGITEEITGADLVQLQIRIARGEPLPEARPHEQGVAIEARVCAEDPEAGFLPSPGQIARFDSALGPQVRVDAGVVAGNSVSSAFDSLIAKVIAKGRDRDEARARLTSALRDFDLVIQGGATNKNYLLEILTSDDFVRGGVDTGWLDRWNRQRSRKRPFVHEALVVAAILSYQAGRRAMRRNFYADAGEVTPDRVPASEGQEIVLTHDAVALRLQVYSVGTWHYRLHFEGDVAGARLVDFGAHAGRLMVGGREFRVLHDVTDTKIRVEVEGFVHQFDRQTAGQVRAAAPSMVVAIRVKPGQRVQAGEPLGLLEAMKMEIGFSAPITGVVSEVPVRQGQQVAAGEVLVVIDQADEQPGSQAGGASPRLPSERDPLAVLFAGTGSGLGEPNLARADRAQPPERRAAMKAVGEEVRRILLGYDIFPDRFEKIIALLEAPIPEGISDAFRHELAEVRSMLSVFADVEELFLHRRRATLSGELAASNHARMHTFVRRIRAEGAGMSEEFLNELRRALGYYDVRSLKHSSALERAVMRLFSTQRDPARRYRLVMAVIGHVNRLASLGEDLSADDALRDALQRIVSMRDAVGDTLADMAIEAIYSIFERPELTRQAEVSTRQVESWLSAVEANQEPPPDEALADLAVAPRVHFERIIGWLHEDEPWRRVIALAAFARRLYAPAVPVTHSSDRARGHWIERLEFADGRVILASLASAAEVAAQLGVLAEYGERSEQPVHAIELIVPLPDGEAPEPRHDEVRAALGHKRNIAQVTLSLVRAKGGERHETFVRTDEGQLERVEMLGVHPEAATRIGLQRYRSFELERLWSPPGIYCFYAKSPIIPDDERIFVLADVRGRASEKGLEATLFEPVFESAFYEATRTLRVNIAARDPRRRLQWNRLIMCVSHDVFLDPELALRLARRLLPATRHLGLEKTIVRLRLLDRKRPQAPPQPTEIVVADAAHSRLSVSWRTPRTDPLEPVSAYERKVVAARRRGDIYPYEIIRMLTRDAEQQSLGQDGSASLPLGTFEEYDLDSESRKPRAVSVAGREPGQQSSAIVFGVISTPTTNIPEGMKRVVVLSDPTMGKGALSGPECDRVCAAIDLAEELGVPVEWLPISSGARIAMDSGTENLDAVARVVRRIVTFTQDGGVIHIIVTGVNVGGQSYWDALATMLMHTRGVLIMTPQASMVLTGQAALAASGSVSASDEVSIGGHERIMGPNGQAQYFAQDLAEAYHILYRHYDYTYVVPGEKGPRHAQTSDPVDRDVRLSPYANKEEGGFATIGDIFDDQTNPGRKRPFAMRALMAAVIDQDGGHLERWQSHAGAETAIVWDARLGGRSSCVIGIESRNVMRWGYRPADGPPEYNGGTLFPQSSKKVARALNAASGNRPAVILANLSGFDGSPESMRKLQLEYGAEIARAIVNFDGPVAFLVVARYHGGAYVVFSRELNPGVRALAVEGSYASVIGGGPAAAVVFPREVRARVFADPRVKESAARLRESPTAEHRAEYDRLEREVTLEKRAEVAREFDTIHTVERAQRVGSLEAIIPAGEIRRRLIACLSLANG